MFEVTLSTTPELEKNGTIIYSVKNRSPQPLKLLTWNTPFAEELTDKSFHIIRDGKQVKYTGRLYKRSHPLGDDFIDFQPGESKSITVFLRSIYDMAAAGSYEVMYRGLFQYRQHGIGKGEVSAGRLMIHPLVESNVIVLNVSTVPLPPVSAHQPPMLVSCSTEETQTLEEAVALAQVYAANAASVLSTTEYPTRASAGRYLAWFGIYDASRYSQVSAIFAEISSALSEEVIEFRCDCNQDLFAWVLPSEPYVINICKEFWNAELSGTDSQAGTIIHEMTHFEIIADTDDHVYGQSGAYDLAKNFPETAISNADSFEFFAENTPHLPMLPLPVLEDDFGNASIIDDIHFTTLSDNYSATYEHSEPHHAGITGGKSLWIGWQSQVTGKARITTFGSSFDTLLGIYKGNQLLNLIEVDSNDDSRDLLQSEVLVSVTSGETYKLAIDGYGGETGLGYVSVQAGLGDIDGNGVLALPDLIAGMQILSGTVELGNLNLLADSDENEKIDMSDILFILNELSSTFQ